MRAKWIAFGAAVGILLAALVLLIWRSATREYSPYPTLDAPAIVLQIQRLNELVSVKYTMQKVIGLEEKKVPVGSEKILLIVQAEVLAGIDLSKITAANVKLLPDRGIQLDLPAPKIIHVVIDDKETKVWDRQITWWTPWVPYNPDLERQARLTAKDELEKAAASMGILDQARRNAEATIHSLLEAFGMKSVTLSIS